MLLNKIIKLKKNKIKKYNYCFKIKYKYYNKCSTL